MYIHESARLEINTKGLPASLVGDLKYEFEHKNPVHYRLKAQRLWPPKTEPPVIVNWHETKDGLLSLPRGGIARVLEIFRRYGLYPETEYTLTERIYEQVDFPPPKVVPYEYQQRCIEAALKEKSGIIKAPTGCLTGDSMISVNRGGKGFKVRLDILVAQFNGTAERYQWDPKIPTMVRARFPDGRVQLVRLRDAYSNGLQSVFDLKTRSGKTITCTSSHRFLTTTGWVRLSDLCVGNHIYVEMSPRPTKTRVHKKTWYRMKRVKFHPFCGRKGVNPSKGGFTVPLHRLVVEAEMNGVPLSEYVTRLNSNPAPEYVYLDPLIWAVHHKDGDSLNNNRENLEVLTHAAHQKAHKADHLANIAVITELDEVVSIEYMGERHTFDLSVDAPNNYIANDIVVHNSGKTILGVVLAAQAGVPFLIVVHSVALLNQWKERIAAVFGNDFETGLIQGKSFYLKPITLAMAQTLHKISDEKWAQINGYFGGVIQDEVQFAAATTFLHSLDKCKAEYRIGLWADHTRKDRKDFLIRDTFGGVIAEISRADLVSKSFVLDPHVVLKPTAFHAEWFLQQRMANDLRNNGLDFDAIYLALKARWPDMKMSEVPRSQPDYNRLIDEMCADPTRNAKILSLTERMVRDGRRVFVFCHRVDHCAALLRDLRGIGLEAGALIGGPENKEEFRRTLDGLQNGGLDVGVGTWQALGTGIDCPRVSGGIMATPINGKQIWGQIRGRLCRTYPGKTDSVLYYLWDKNVFADTPARNMSKWNTRCSIELAPGDLEDVKAYLRRQ